MSHLLKQQRSIEDTMKMLWVSLFPMLSGEVIGREMFQIKTMMPDSFYSHQLGCNTLYLVDESSNSWERVRISTIEITCKYLQVLLFLPLTCFCVCMCDCVHA